MYQLVIGTHIYVANADKKFIKKVRQHLTFSNPEFEQALRLGLSLYGKPKTVTTMQIVGNDTIKIPLGYKDWLLDLINTDGTDYELIDQRIDNDINVKLSHFELRDYQSKIINDVTERNLIVLPAGGGKTVTACGIINKVKQRTLWITHTKELANQAKDVLELALGLEVGMIGGGKDTSKGKDIIVAMVQTLGKRELLIETLSESIGCVIVDEAHHTPSTSFHKIISKLKPKYMYGLTATPDRKDGKSYLLEGAFGEIVTSITRDDLYKDNKLIIPELKQIYTNFTGTNYQQGDVFNLGGDGGEYQSLVNKLLEDKDRYDLVVDTLKPVVKTRRVLVIGDRIEYLIRLSNSLDLPIVTGSTRKEERKRLIDEIREGKIKSFIATSQLVREGLDIPELDTLAITTPMAGDKKGNDGSALEQAVGRIQRQDKNNPNKKAIVYDFIEYENGIFKSQWYSRRRVYKRLGIKLENRQKVAISDMLDDIIF